MNSKAFNHILKLLALTHVTPKPNTQRALIIYSWITIIGVVFVTIFSFTTDVYGDGYEVSSFVISAVFLSVVLAHIVSIIESLAKREQQLMFFVNLQHIDDIFRFKLKNKINMEPKRRKLVWKYAIASSLVLSHFFLYIMCISLHEYSGFFWSGFISVIVSRVRFIQACIYVELITCRLRHMNFILKQYAMLKHYPQNKILDYIEENSREKLLALKLIYTQLQDLVDSFNGIFGWSILTLVIYYCLDLTCNAYWTFLILDFVLPIYVAPECYATIFQIMLVLTYFCHACSNCLNEIVTTKQQLQKMIATPMTEHENYLIKQFLLQIHLQPIEIHAKKFFSVNFQLLSSICVLICGYLVILVQFGYTENEI